jgi:hypothetical protein
MIQTAYEYPDDKHKKPENTYLFLAKTWKSETSDSRDSLVASASVASDATKLTGGDEDENEAPATLVAIPFLFLRRLILRLRFWIPPLSLLMLSSAHLKIVRECGQDA